MQDCSLHVRILSQNDNDVYSVYLYVDDAAQEDNTSSSVNMKLVREGYATVIPGCQLDIDLDLEPEDAHELGKILLFS